MITPTKLVGISVASVGIAGGSAGAMYAFWPETISIEKKLIEENKKILGEGNEALWGIKLATYNRIKSKHEEIKLGGDKWSDLKKWCLQQTKSSFDEKKQKLYEGVKEVCIVPSHREKFKNASKDLAGNDDWTSKAQEYTGTGDKVIVGIKKDSTTAKQLETWCGKALEKEYEDDQKNDYPLVLKWCTKEGS
ncbi:hypothetical protein A6V39_03620 [Candidatus Mycoplasma haematobovis]|uniref:Uncharacterized protein n=1 Tax=Candidatus Mycoplasma haematobovis TaxID=432608 RepID=A0A1A9QDE7_9MOLU|nr:hypothetical protein [Candidatus Mycoplasma haematobovis]OAL09975.1 hypothetical protein A6V39_03620 [Candidatus Mycoplasma haematobovis]